MTNFTIYDGRPEFWQWDSEQKIIIDKRISQIDEVHFCNVSDTDNTLTVTPRYEDGVMVADVPNILLQQDEAIKVYVYVFDNGTRTMHYSIFEVRARPKPTDYVYTPTEVKSWDELDSRVDDLEALDHPTALTNAEINLIFGDNENE